MLGKWTPAEERSQITTMVFSGVPFGTAITMVVGGYIIRFFGWPMLFYSVGVFSIVWFTLWTFLVFSDPSEHPKISFEELEYIQASTKSNGPIHLQEGVS
jgi:MFS family permease